jgi:hypothetical protein
VFSGSKSALLAAKNADYALIFTEEWRRVGEQKSIGFSFCFDVFSTIDQGNMCRPPIHLKPNSI